MKQARFSIVTIAMNDLAGLKETARTVEAQAFSDFEWIIVDGGSTDGTLHFLTSLNQPSCRWTSEPDKGLFDAMNKGLDAATGQYVIFMNSGDRFAQRDVLARVDAQISQHGKDPVLVFGDAYEETLSGQLLLKPAQSANAIKRGMFTHHQAMFYARKAVGNIRYDCRFKVSADYDFTCRVMIAERNTFRAHFPMCIFKRGGNSENRSKLGWQENLAIQKKVLRLGPIRRTINYVSYIGTGLMRTHMRSLYDRIRFRSAVPSHAGR